MGIFSYRSGEDDEGGIDGWFNLLITDSQAQGPGCRMLLKGRFGAKTSDSVGSVGSEGAWTEADSPDRGCDSSGAGEDAVWFGCEAVASAEDDGYEDSGCGGYEEDGSGWATEDATTDSSGCEGDSYDSSDTSDGSGSANCEGDGYDSYDSDDIWDSDSADCAGDAEAAVPMLRPVHRKNRKKSDPIRGLLRFFPELTAGLFISLMKRNQRRRG